MNLQRGQQESHLDFARRRAIMVAGYQNDLEVKRSLGSYEKATWWVGRCAADPTLRHPYASRTGHLHGAWAEDVQALREELCAEAGQELNHFAALQRVTPKSIARVQQMNINEARKVVASVAAEAKAVIDSAAGQGLTRAQAVKIMQIVCDEEEEFEELADNLKNAEAGSEDETLNPKS